MTKVQIWGRSRPENPKSWESLDLDLGIHRMGGVPRIGDHIYVDEENGWDGMVEDIRWELSSELLEVFVLLPWRDDKYVGTWMPSNEAV